MKEKISEDKKIKLDMIVTTILFMLTVALGVLIVYNPKFVGIGIICLGFLIFNVFTTLYRLNLFIVRRLLRR